MDVKIDWLSFTVPVYAGTLDLEQYATHVVGGLLVAVGEHCFNWMFDTQWIERKAGRAPYAYSHTIGTSGIVVFSNPKRNDVLVELSGKACDYIRIVGVQEELLERVKNRVTRLDLACDMETSTTPVDFAPRSQYATTKTYSEISSRTGQTVYLGSMASERYTRVYRYAYPHPRARCLRVEFVFRRKVARAVVDQILGEGETSVAIWAGNRENFNHSAWIHDDSQITIKTGTRQEWDAGRTLTWLRRQVKPAVRRLMAEMEIADQEKFLREVFL